MGENPLFDKSGILSLILRDASAVKKIAIKVPSLSFPNTYAKFHLFSTSDDLYRGGEGFQVSKLSAQIYVNHFKENRNMHQLTLELMIPHNNKKMLLKAY